MEEVGCEAPQLAKELLTGIWLLLGEEKAVRR